LDCDFGCDYDLASENETVGDCVNDFGFDFG
jgi:hypothetical protein